MCKPARYRPRLISGGPASCSTGWSLHRLYAAYPLTGAGHIRSLASSRSSSWRSLRELQTPPEKCFRTRSASQSSSRLLKNVLERSGCARLIQHSGPWRTKDSAPRGPGFEHCASLIPSRVFQQPARLISGGPASCSTGWSLHRLYAAYPLTGGGHIRSLASSRSSSWRYLRDQ